MSVALVLSGGGARGAFEVGAALFLYDIYGIRPDIICATSVGAISGAKLAEGGTPDEKRAALEELKNIWLELKRYSDMWEEADWLVELGDLQVGKDTIRDLVLPAVTGQPSTTVHGETPFIQDNFPWILDIRALLGGFYQLITTVPAIKKKADQGKLRSILRLRPIENKMRGIVETAGTITRVPPRLDSGKVRRSGVKLRLAMVSLETGALRYVTEDGRLLERDNATPVLAPTIKQRDPACEQQAAEVVRLQAIIGGPLRAHSIDQINTAKAALPNALKALENCDRDHPPSMVQPSVDLTTAVIASSTMPAIFEPRLIGGEHYVDGGVREIAPVEVAFDIGGDRLEQVYVVMASTQNIPRMPSFAAADFFSVMMHSLVDLGLNEITRDDAFPPRGWSKPCDVIAPSFDLYNPTVIDPGLIQIHMDYGFMRAADIARHKPLPVLEEGADRRFGLREGTTGPATIWSQPIEPVRDSDLAPEKAMQLSDAVTLLRLSAWDTEFVVHSQPHYLNLNAPLLPYRPADKFSAVHWTRLLKWLTKAVIDYRAQHSLPSPRFTTIPWLNWESHPWSTGNPWLEFDTLSGTVEFIEFKDYLPQGALIRDPDNGAIYILQNGARIHIKDEAEFNSLGLSSADVRHVPPGVADCLPMEQR